ncbi:MAG: porin, partial [Burkholderiaceae bacterium]
VIGTTRSRTSNGLQYILPSNLGGFYGEAMYAFGEQPDNAGAPAGSFEDNGNYYGGRIGFKSGPLDIAISAGLTEVNVNVPAGSILSDDRSVVNAGITYDFGVIKLFGLYSKQTRDNFSWTGLNLGGGVSSAAGGDAEADAYSIGLTVPFGPGTFKAGYSSLELKNGNGPGSTPSADKFAIGYQYDLSKRTALYVTYASLKNKDAGAGANATGGLTAGASRQRGLAGTAVTSPTSTSTAFDIGIRHNF